MRKIIQLITIFALMNCSTPRKKMVDVNLNNSSKKILVYDTLQVNTEVNFIPKDESNGYCSIKTSFNLSKEKDTSFCFETEKRKVINYYYSENNTILQHFFDSNNLMVFSRSYLIENKSYFSYEKLYDDLANETDTTIVFKHLNSIRNGVWRYWDSNGDSIKTENWEKGILRP
jgi:hypothetical protein